MADTALSVFRNEKKYILPFRNALSIRGKLDEILARDGHSETWGYMVRSLYFDSVNNIDYKTKLAGVEKRKKIRLRIYSTASKKCKLEMKAKDGDLQHKVSLWISRGSKTIEFPIPRQQDEHPLHPLQSVFAISLLPYSFPSDTLFKSISRNINSLLNN